MNRSWTLHKETLFQEIYGVFSFPARPWGHGEAVWHRLRDEGESSENYFCSFFTISNFAVMLTDSKQTQSRYTW